MGYCDFYVMYETHCSNVLFFTSHKIFKALLLESDMENEMESWRLYFTDKYYKEMKNVSMQVFVISLLINKQRPNI